MFNRKFETYEKIILIFAALLVIMLIIMALPEKPKQEYAKDPYLRAVNSIYGTSKTASNHSAWFPLIYNIADGTQCLVEGHYLYNLNKPIKSSKYNRPEYVGYKKLCNIFKAELKGKNGKGCKNEIRPFTNKEISEFNKFFNDNYSFETKDGAQWLVMLDTYTLPQNNKLEGAKYLANIFVDVNGKNSHFLNTINGQEPDTLWFKLTSDGSLIPATNDSKKYYSQYLSDKKIEAKIKDSVTENDIKVPLSAFEEYK